MSQPFTGLLILITISCVCFVLTYDQKTKQLSKDTVETQNENKIETETKTDIAMEKHDKMETSLSGPQK